MMMYVMRGRHSRRRPNCQAPRSHFLNNGVIPEPYHAVGQKLDDAPPMPEHWKIGKGARFRRLKAAFLFIGVGRRSMEEFWARSYPGSDLYERGRDEMRDRIIHINVVAGLLLTTIAAFCTTDPPSNSRLLPYTRSDSYMVFLISLGISFGGLIVGSAIVFVIARSSSDWFCNTMMRTRGRIWGTMFILSYPFISIGISTLCFAAALLMTAARSEVAVVKYGAHMLLVGPLSCAFLFVWIAHK